MMASWRYCFFLFVNLETSVILMLLCSFILSSPPFYESTWNLTHLLSFCEHVFSSFSSIFLDFFVYAFLLLFLGRFCVELLSGSFDTYWTPDGAGSHVDFIFFAKKWSLLSTAFEDIDPSNNFCCLVIGRRSKLSPMKSSGSSSNVYGFLTMDWFELLLYILKLSKLVSCYESIEIFYTLLPSTLSIIVNMPFLKLVFWLSPIQ